MSTAQLVDRGRMEIKLGSFAVGSATMLADSSILPTVQDYRRRVSGQMMPLDKPGIRERIPTAEYHVSRKVDGEFTVLVYRNGEVFTINPGGTVRMGMPWQEEARKQLAAASVTEAMIVGELYVENTERRPRVHDVVTVARQPQSLTDLERLRFAVFDIASRDGKQVTEPFTETWQTIQRWFGDGTLVHPVEAKYLKDPSEIVDLFEEWVEGQGAEGLVVRSDEAGTFKIKPRHTLDAVVVGFTESTDDRAGMVHDLLLAVMRPDGTLHILSRVGGGFSDELRRQMLSDLKDRIVESEYAEVNSDHVAYQMVRPDWIIEISCLDIISQNTRGGTINRMVLDFEKGDQPGYKVVRRLPLATIISPQFVRMREDKKAHPKDVSITQISDRVEVPQIDADAREFALPKTSMLRREVFTKQLKGETMVRKFVLLKTNKESISDEYPAYVIHYTDFSPNRKDALSREVLISNSVDQIEQLYNGLKEENIKKGWTAHSGVIQTSTPPLADTATAEPLNHDVKSLEDQDPDQPPAKPKRAPRKKATNSEANEASVDSTVEVTSAPKPVVKKPANRKKEE
jgi:ATP dependent DNA ligase C terminal region/ATP dependent DNA ligase domain